MRRAYTARARRGHATVLQACQCRRRAPLSESARKAPNALMKASRAPGCESERGEGRGGEVEG